LEPQNIVLIKGSLSRKMGEIVTGLSMKTTGAIRQKAP
jgi:hypothetical protein